MKVQSKAREAINSVVSQRRYIKKKVFPYLFVRNVCKSEPFELYLLLTYTIIQKNICVFLSSCFHREQTVRFFCVFFFFSCRIFFHFRATCFFEKPERSLNRSNVFHFITAVVGIWCEKETLQWCISFTLTLYSLTIEMNLQYHHSFKFFIQLHSVNYCVYTSPYVTGDFCIVF